MGSGSILDAVFSDMPKCMEKGVLNGVSSATNNLMLHNEKQIYFFQFGFSLQSKSNI